MMHETVPSDCDPLGPELTLAWLREALRQEGLEILALDRLDDDGIRLEYTAPEAVAGNITGVYIALHADEREWRDRRPAADVPLIWKPGTIEAVKHVNETGEHILQTYEVRPEWAARYLDGDWSMDEVWTRVEETIQTVDEVGR